MESSKAKILIVDDVEVNRFVLSEILSDTYEIEQAANGKDALAKLYGDDKKPHLALLDVIMPDMDGFEVNRIMKSDPSLKKVPVIFITATEDERKGLAAGAVDFISKPFDPETVKLRVANHIELALYREQLEIMVDEKSREIIESKELFLDSMANLIEYRSLESGLHVKRTKELTRLLILHMIKTGRYAQQFVDGDYEAMIKAVPLHDIGKIAVPDNILLKPGRLTPEEFDVIKTHTTVGGQIIKSLMSSKKDVYLSHCYDICRFHHEHWDGLGYPDKLSGENIPLSARVVAVVDVYDALVSKRCYKDSLSHDEAADIIRNSAGNHLDPLVVEAFMEIKKDVKALSVKLQEE
ncbi:MAG: response regulator [Oscillospiraceae bacterium]|jgi:putative two-component system response regulator|nr:response regulator [Oscillospiraceae bacterium]